MDEFVLIDAVVAAMADATAGPYVVLGPGDDGAITIVPDGSQVITSVDTLVEGVHFPAGAAGALIGHRALGVSVSDLAAMGATPTHAVIAVTLRTEQEDWLLDFARGAAVAAQRMNIAIAGGNLARGPLNISVTAVGFVPTGAALTRSGAGAGDAIFVSGEIGAAALVVARSLQGDGVANVERLRTREPNHPLVRYYMPQPRIALGVALRGVASAAIDVSDGLLADLEHLCAASGVGARIELERVPVAAGAAALPALGAGDDYELLFTVPAALAGRLDANVGGVAVTRIGSIVAGSTIEVHHAGHVVDVAHAGYRHFG
jgi:thiamine-monophosphate kinase